MSSQSIRAIRATTQSLSSSPNKRLKVDRSSSLQSATPSFSGYRIALIAGHLLTAARISIWNEQLSKRGAVVQDSITDNTTHAVVSSEYHGWDALSPSQQTSVHFHTVDWITEALRHKRIPSAEQFVWRPKNTQSNAKSTRQIQAAMPLPPPESPPRLIHTSSSVSSRLAVEPRFSSPQYQSTSNMSNITGCSDGSSPVRSPPSSPPPLSQALSASPQHPRQPPARTHSLLTQHNITIDDDGQQHDGETEYLVHHSLLPSITAPVVTAQPWHERQKPHLACQMVGESVVNHNGHLTGPLERLEEINGSLGDKWRKYAYRKAVGILKRYPSKIESEDDLEQVSYIPGMGKKMIEKLKEILATGRLMKLNTLEQDDRVQIIERFSKIHGVGGATAAKWYAIGLRTLDDLINNNKNIILTDQQKLGLKFYEDKQKRIPREEVTAIQQYVWRIANSILANTTVICCGSYRRGKPHSGDVDLLITHPSFTDEIDGMTLREQFMVVLMKRLNSDITPPYWYTNEAIKREQNGETNGDYDPTTASHNITKDNPDEQTHSIKCEDTIKVKAEFDDAVTSMPTVKSEFANAAHSSATVKREYNNIVKLENGIKHESAVKNEHTLHSHNKNNTNDDEDDNNEDDDNAVTSEYDLSNTSKRLPPFISGQLQPFEQLTLRHAQANFLGFCCLPNNHPLYSGIHRRLDIKVYPLSMFPFALLYFTGSDHFNRSMRFYAKKVGWTLSDHGLSRAVRVHGTKVWTDRTVICRSEKDIFVAMGLKYIPPTQRNVYEVWDDKTMEQAVIMPSILSDQVQQHQQQQQDQQHDDNELYHHTMNTIDDTVTHIEIDLV